MVMCFAPDCKHYSTKHGCRFFVFPKGENHMVEVAKLFPMKYVCRREDREPSKYSLVCSCHFKDGDRNNRPTIYEHNKEKLFKLSPEKKKRRHVSPLKKSVPLVKELNLPGPSTGAMSEIASTSTVEKSVTPTSTATASTETSTSTAGTSQLAVNFESLEIKEPREFHFVAMEEAEKYFLNQQVTELSAQVKNLSVSFSWDQISNNEKRILMYTGLPNKDIFMALFYLMDNFELNYYYGWSVIGVSKINQLLLTLMKLRLNLNHEDLACRFNVSRTTVSNIIFTWTHALLEVIFEQLMKEIPGRHKNKLCSPSAFSTFTNCRIIIDCTEIQAISPINMEKQQLTYSSYKHMDTLKGMIGVAPNGVCTYLSNLYPGSISDKKLFEHCCLAEKLVPGDLVIADKGFLIGDLLPEGVNLNVPPFLTTPQFTEEQVLQTQKIARARIHVERAIRRIKCYDILNKIPSKLIPLSSYVFQVCGALTNFQYPLIKEVEDMFCSNE